MEKHITAVWFVFCNTSVARESAYYHQPGVVSRRLSNYLPTYLPTYYYLPTTTATTYYDYHYC